MQSFIARVGISVDTRNLDKFNGGFKKLFSPLNAVRVASSMAVDRRKRIIYRVDKDGEPIAPLAQFTIQKKGNDWPLVETGEMMEDIVAKTLFGALEPTASLGFTDAENSFKMHEAIVGDNNVLYYRPVRDMWTVGERDLFVISQELVQIIKDDFL